MRGMGRGTYGGLEDWEGGRTEGKEKGEGRSNEAMEKEERGSLRGLIEGEGWKSEEMEIAENGGSSGKMEKGKGGSTIERKEEEGINMLWRGKREKR
jgi:hypothetical protein